LRAFSPEKHISISNSWFTFLEHTVWRGLMRWRGPYQQRGKLGLVKERASEAVSTHSICVTSTGNGSHLSTKMRGSPLVQNHALTALDKTALCGQLLCPCPPSKACIAPATCCSAHVSRIYRCRQCRSCGGTSSRALGCMGHVGNVTACMCLLRTGADDMQVELMLASAMFRPSCS